MSKARPGPDFALSSATGPTARQPGQPKSAEIESAARVRGLSYVYIPVMGFPGAEQVAAFGEALAAADGPVLAFCRSGTRSITTWALTQAITKTLSRDELLRVAADAGYDLSAAIGG